MRGFQVLAIAAAVAAVATTAAAQYRAPRTASGVPDLEGLWSNASLTELERPPAFKALIVPEAEAKAFEAAHPRKPATPGGVGQEDTEWWELDVGLARIDGQARSSWIVEPPDGRLPYTPAGLKAVQAGFRAVLGAFDGPEARPPAERCLVGIGGISLPPVMNTNYNSQFQIAQTPDHVVIVSEMNHDARIIPLKDRPPSLGPEWAGHAVGHWEGDTLVVETTDFRAEAALRFPHRLYVSPGARVTERFTRTGRDQIRYAFTVDDPATYSRPWRGEMPLTRTKGPMFEFACHEGNYSMSGALAGARRQARDAADLPSTPGQTVGR